MKLFITEEIIQGKQYLFRGESNNSYQRNYSKKNKLRFNSRFFGYELFDGIYKFGNVVMYELLPNSRIWDYDVTTQEFVEEFDLQDYKVDELYKIYKIHSLSELYECGGSIHFDLHDSYHAFQLVCIAFLEDNYKNQYDGIIWYEPFDTPETQYMIWNDKAIRKVPYKEAKYLLSEFEDELNSKGVTGTNYQPDEWGEKHFNLHR